jgi:hypothetical protein
LIDEINDASETEELDDRLDDDSDAEDNEAEDMDEVIHLDTTLDLTSFFHVK